MHDLLHYFPWAASRKSFSPKCGDRRRGHPDPKNFRCPNPYNAVFWIVKTSELEMIFICRVPSMIHLFVGLRLNVTELQRCWDCFSLTSIRYAFWPNTSISTSDRDLKFECLARRVSGWSDAPMASSSCSSQPMFARGRKATRSRSQLCWNIRRPQKAKASARRRSVLSWVFLGTPLLHKIGAMLGKTLSTRCCEISEWTIQRTQDSIDGYPKWPALVVLFRSGKRTNIPTRPVSQSVCNGSCRYSGALRGSRCVCGDPLSFPFSQRYQLECIRDKDQIKKDCRPSVIPRTLILFRSHLLMYSRTKATAWLARTLEIHAIEMITTRG